MGENRRWPKAAERQTIERVNRNVTFRTDWGRPTDPRHQEAVCRLAMAASIRRSGTSQSNATAANAAIAIHGAMNHAAAVPSPYNTNEALPLKSLPSAPANELSLQWCKMSWFCRTE